MHARIIAFLSIVRGEEDATVQPDWPAEVAFKIHKSFLHGRSALYYFAIIVAITATAAILEKRFLPRRCVRNNGTRNNTVD